MPGDGWGSHVSVLNLLLAVIRPSRVVEHGCGLHSTPLFAGYAETVVAVDTDPEWIKKAREAVPDNCTILLGDAMTPEMLAGADLVFVDGARDGRLPAIQAAQDAAVPVIVWHDAEMGSYYGYDRIDQPMGSRCLYYRANWGRRKMTAVLLSGRWSSLTLPCPEDHEEVPA